MRTSFRKKQNRLACGLLSAWLLVGCTGTGASSSLVEKTASTFAMDTLVTQTAYGEGAEEAMREVNMALADMEKELSLFQPEGEIAHINRQAGQSGVEVSAETAALLSQALSFSGQSKDAFAITIAPLTLAWGVTGETPRVVPQEEIETLLPLVDDAAVELEGQTVRLPRQGMGIDLGGIAKGAACTEAAEIYEKHGVESALLFIGGNIYARGTKPGGSAWRVGFRDPEGEGESSIASFDLTDQVVAVSGGYERYFEEDGQTYIHIIDPRTGRPAESDILSVGVICTDGAEADFWSTTLFVQGVEGALDYMKGGGVAIVLDRQNRLYVSAGLQEVFRMHGEQESQYEVIFVPEEEGVA